MESEDTGEGFLAQTLRFAASTQVRPDGALQIAF
jgi:hypothetical protein